MMFSSKHLKSFGQSGRPMGDGVSVELVAGCTDMSAPPAAKCKGG